MKNFPKKYQNSPSPKPENSLLPKIWIKITKLLYDDAFTNLKI
jgi:hypothetical protein